MSCLRIVSLGFLFYACGMVLTSAFNGAGDTWTPTWINFGIFWLFEIPLAWVLATRTPLGPTGVFWALTLAYSMLAVVSAIIFRRGRWKTRRFEDVQRATCYGATCWTCCVGRAACSCRVRRATCDVPSATCGPRSVVSGRSVVRESHVASCRHVAPWHVEHVEHVALEHVAPSTQHVEHVAPSTQHVARGGSACPSSTISSATPATPSARFPGCRCWPPSSSSRSASGLASTSWCSPGSRRSCCSRCPGVAHARQLVFVEPRSEAGTYPGVSWQEYEDLRDRLRTFDSLIAFRMVPFNVGEPSRNERIYGQLVSGNYFSGLGLTPSAGRFFRAGRGVAVGPSDFVMVVSHGLALSPLRQPGGGDRPEPSRQRSRRGHRRRRPRTLPGHGARPRLLDVGPGHARALAARGLARARLARGEGLRRARAARGRRDPGPGAGGRRGRDARAGPRSIPRATAAWPGR